MSSILKQKNNRLSFRDKLHLDNDVNLNLVHKKEEEESTKRLADKLGLAYINLQFIPINPDALKILTKEQAQQALNAFLATPEGENETDYCYITPLALGQPVNFDYIYDTQRH